MEIGKIIRKPTLLLTRANPETVERLRKMGIKVDDRDKNNDIDLRGHRFENKDLSGLDFKDINVQGGFFNNCNLSDVDFSTNDLCNCIFIDVIISTQTIFPRNFQYLKQSGLVAFSEKKQ